MEEKKSHPYSEHDENAPGRNESSSTGDHDNTIGNEKVTNLAEVNVANADYSAAIEENPPNPWGEL